MTVISKSFAKRAMMVLAVLLTALTADATEFITDVKLIGYKNKTQFDNLQDKLEKEGWTAINKDLNADAGGDYIHLLYKSEANTDGLNHGYITDFYILGSKSGSVDEEVTYQGRTYHLVSFEGSTEFENSNGDLNRGAGGDYIHLYYTKDPMNEQAVSEIVFDNSESGALGNQGGSTAYDLNNKAGGKYIYMHLKKENATTVKYISYTYDTTNGLKSETKTCSSSKVVSSNDKSWASGWYLVSGNVEISDRIKVSGTVNLILLDGCTLNAKKGIELTNGNTLNIYAQSEGANAGKLKAIATNEEKCAGIGGGEFKPCGTVTIYGGAVEAHGGDGGAGIGGGDSGAGGTVTIYGGIVEAHGGEYSAGIGGGFDGAGGTVTIYGGTVEAHGGAAAAGVGVGLNGAGGDVTIYGGAVKAHGGFDGAGIGGGYGSKGGSVSIYGGTVEANGGENAAGIGGGSGGNGGSVSIYGGTVEAKGGENGVGIGGGCDSWVPGTLKIGDGLKVYDVDNPSTPIATGPQENVETRTQYMFVGKISPVSYIKYSFDEETKTLTSEKNKCYDYTEVTSSTTTFSNGWYVLSSSQSFDNRITVSGTVNLILCDGCTLEANKGVELTNGNTLNIFAQSEGANAGKLKAIATSEKDVAGIGGGDGIDCGTVTIYSGTVEVWGGEDGAGIGGGNGGSGGTVTIYSGAVEAHGGDYAAGIGGGYGGSGGTVTIYGGVVEAHGGDNGAGIGGSAASGGTVTIYGGVVEAHGGQDGAGIGGGYSGSGGEVTIYGGVVAAYGGWDSAGIGAGRHGLGGTLKIGEGLSAWGSENMISITYIAIGPEDNVRDRARNMFVGKKFPVYYLKYSFDEDTKTLTSKKTYCDDYTEVTSSTTTFSNGWYVLSRSQSFDNRITVSGTVNLILLDGCTLEAKKGIELTKGNTLNIYAQSEGANAGKLKAIATNEEKCAGIGGGNYSAGGTMTIYGGTVEARGGKHGAGIGGGFNGSGGTVTIYGGVVEAHGGEHGAGIGGGFNGDGGTVTIYGGTVEAHGGESGAGIGVGYNGAGGDVTIYGGTVEAHGGMNAAGLGGGYTCNGITVSIYGGKVVAYGDYLSTGIGAGRGGNGNGTLKIGDGVKVYGGNSKNPTTVIATGPQENVGSRPRYMIVTDHLKGDANADWKVNAADLVEMVNAKNNKASDRFVLKNADIDGSGNITESDIDAVEKIIMQK